MRGLWTRVPEDALLEKPGRSKGTVRRREKVACRGRGRLW